jgi:hypothetical protein
MTSGRDRTGRRVPTLTEVIVPATTVDLLLDVPSETPDIDIHALGTAQTGADASSAAEATLPFTKATIPSVSALLATVEHDADSQANAVPAPSYLDPEGHERAPSWPFGPEATRQVREDHPANEGSLLSLLDPLSGPDAKRRVWGRSIEEETSLARVMADLQRELDAGLDGRLREVLVPALARATESVLRETREQLAATLRESIERAVAQELSRHRNR